LWVGSIAIATAVTAATTTVAATATAAAATTTVAATATAAAAATTTTTATVTTATAAATTTAASATFTGTGFVDGDRTTADFLTVEAFNGLTGFFVVCHGDEGEATRTTGFTVGDQRDIFDFTECTEFR
jgi:hypothetical protein